MGKNVRETFSINRTGFVVFILFCLSFVAASPFFAEGWFWTHEQLSPVGRVIAVTDQLRHGDFYPRWLSSTYMGKGSPFFKFYSPGFYFTVAYI
jgi:uncharacterized membrane protein